jgi:glucose-6-phosphate isomerase
MQERAADDPGRCFAIEAGLGEVVIVPPGWAHATVSADPARPMTFGAWCDREYGFEYDEVRARGGLAYYPLLAEDGRVIWQPNPRYRASPLTVRGARAYPELGLEARVPVYELFARDPAAVQWVSDPARVAHLWEMFEP